MKWLLLPVILSGCTHCIIKLQHTDFAPAPYRAQEFCLHSDGHVTERTCFRSGTPIPRVPPPTCPKESR